MKKVAIVVGHKESRQGASNKSSGVTEFLFNLNLSSLIYDKLDENENFECVIVYRASYSRLPDKINSLNPDLIICLHCNAFNEKVSGTEVLYYHKSKKSRDIAQRLQDEIIGALALPDRGIKAIDSEDRGCHVLKNTNAPCVIAEPFFIDNNTDLMVVDNRLERLVTAYVRVIDFVLQSDWSGREYVQPEGKLIVNPHMNENRVIEPDAWLGLHDSIISNKEYKYLSSLNKTPLSAIDERLVGLLWKGAIPLYRRVD